MNSQAVLVSFILGLQLCLEDEKAMGQRQEDIGGLAGLDVEGVRNNTEALLGVRGVSPPYGK